MPDGHGLVARQVGLDLRGQEAIDLCTTDDEKCPAGLGDLPLLLWNLAANAAAEIWVSWLFMATKK